MAFNKNVPLAANQISADLVSINDNWEYIINNSYCYAADAEASDAYVITLAPVITSYTTGMVIHFKANTANTGACTLNVNTVGAKSIKKLHDTDPATGDIEVGQIVTVVYDGTNFQMQSQIAKGKLDNIKGDTTPELGGELDCGAHSVGFTQQLTTGDGTTTIDWKLGNKFKFTFGAQNETFTFTAPSNSCNLLLLMVQDATGGRTVTWPGTVKWVDSIEPSWGTGADAINIATFYYDGTSYYGAGGADFG